MIVIDASVWVSRLVSGDVHHEASRRWLAEQIAQGMPIVGPSLLLAEIAGAISPQTGRPRLARSALRLLERVPGLRLLPLDQRLGTMAGQLAATLGLRGADAVYVATARMLGVPLMTWDLEQRERGGRVVSVRSPPDSF